ncbi:MAG: DNA translocase FtsK [Planctomycetaceae bacterium]
MIDYRRLRTDLLALALLAVSLFIGLSLFSYNPVDPPSTLVFPQQAQVQNLCGPFGAVVAHGLHLTLGLGAWLAWGCMVWMDLRLFSRNELRDASLRLAGWALVCCAVCLALQITLPRLGDGPVVGSGGYLGAWGATLLSDHFSTVGSLIIIGTVATAGLLLTSETWPFQLALVTVTVPLRLMGMPLGRRKTSATNLSKGSTDNTSLAKDAATVASAVESQVEAASLPVVRSFVASAEVAKESTGSARTHEVEKVDEMDDQPSMSSTFKVNRPAVSRLAEGGEFDGQGADDIWADNHHYELPPLDFLQEAEEFPFELLASKAQVAANILEKTFQQFGLNVKVTEVDTGPVVTQFELELEPGLRVSKVVNLQDDLAIALRVPAVRVVSPIPGKNTVGVEVPNEKRVMVRLREIIEACSEQADSMRVPLFLGKDVSGRPLVVDMAKMPHLLIAGRTGTGKSVCLNTLITSILMTRSPEDVRMLMIDPKMVELSPYMKIPHLMHPVITDMKKAEAVLAWAVDKMEERYDLLSKVGVRHLDSYNKLGRDKVLEKMGIDADSDEADAVPERMPYIVIVADEMADLIMTSGKEVESLIIRLAQKSRAVGIHLVLATQKPTVDVITGLIKSNLPARISFQVASRTDSRVVLDEGGAERLLGNGDMLYLAPGTSTLTRAQGTYISDEELSEVLEFFDQYETQYEDEIEQATKAAMQTDTASADEDRSKDDLYPQAVELVIGEGRGSVSMLQTRLGIGYGRSARMIGWMAADGILGEHNGSKPREVICTFEDWQSRQRGVLQESY